MGRTGLLALLFFSREGRTGLSEAFWPGRMAPAGLPASPGSTRIRPTGQTASICAGRMGASGVTEAFPQRASRRSGLLCAPSSMRRGDTGWLRFYRSAVRASREVSRSRRRPPQNELGTTPAPGVVFRARAENTAADQGPLRQMTPSDRPARARSGTREARVLPGSPGNPGARLICYLRACRLPPFPYFTPEPPRAEPCAAGAGSPVMRFNSRI